MKNTILSFYNFIKQYKNQNSKLVYKINLLFTSVDYQQRDPLGLQFSVWQFIR